MPVGNRLPNCHSMGCAMKFEIDRKRRLKWTVQDLLWTNTPWFLLLVVGTIVAVVISGKAE